MPELKRETKAHTGYLIRCHKLKPLFPPCRKKINMNINTILKMSNKIYTLLSPRWMFKCARPPHLTPGEIFLAVVHS